MLIGKRFLVVVGLLTVFPSMVLSEDCFRRTLGPGATLWSPTSGYWDSDTDAVDVFVVDVYREQMVSTSRELDILSRQTMGRDGWPFLVREHRGGESVFVEWTYPYLDPETEKVTFPDDIYETLRGADGALTVGDRPMVSTRDIFVSVNGKREFEILELFDWQRFGNGFFAYADYRFSGDKVGAGSGFIYIDDNKRVMPVIELDDWQSPAVRHYIRTEPYIAVLDSKTAFVLDFGVETADSPPDIPTQLIKVERNATAFHTTTVPLPAEYRIPRPKPPMFPTDPYRGPREELELMRLLEKSAMVHSLFASDGKIFLLAKGPINAAGETTWKVVEIDGNSGEEKGYTQLPTTAANLSVVPGPLFWAFYERNAVSTIGQEQYPLSKAETILLVRSEGIEGVDPSKGESGLECVQLTGDDGMWMSSLVVN